MGGGRGGSQVATNTEVAFSRLLRAIESQIHGMRRTFMPFRVVPRGHEMPKSKRSFAKRNRKSLGAAAAALRCAACLAMSALMEAEYPEELWIPRETDLDLTDDSSSDDNDDDENIDEIKSEGSDGSRSKEEGLDFEEGRPTMRPCQQGARVFSSASTHGSRALAAEVKRVALGTSSVHGYSSTGTPWLYARRLSAIRQQNALFLSWCRAWIEELYGTPCSAVRAPRTGAVRTVQTPLRSIIGLIRLHPAV